MKRTIVSTAVAAAIMFGATGCGNNKTKDETVQALQQATPKVFLEKRKETFEKKIMALSSKGFDINRTNEGHYLMTVKDEKQVLSSLLNMMNAGTTSPQDRAVIEELLKDAKIGVDVDWNKYASNTKESVFAYYLGNGKEVPYVAKIFSEKKIAAYLSYNGKGQLKQLNIKDIDETIKVDTNTTHIILKDMHAVIQKSPTQDSNESAYDLYGGSFSYEMIDQENNNTLRFSYNNPECKITKTNAYLGKEQCTFPSFDIDFKSTVQEEINIHFAMKDTSFSYDNTAKNNKISSNLDFQISSIDITGKAGIDNGSMHMNDIKALLKVDNIDESILKSYMILLQNPPKDYNKTVTQVMSFVGKMYSSGITFNSTVSVASMDGESDKGTFTLDTYKGQGKGSFDKTINYQETDSIKNITVQDKKTKKTLFALDHFRFGYGINDLYNFIPPFMDFSSNIVTQSQSNNPQITDDTKKKLTDMGKDLVHHGFGFALDPIGWDTIEGEAKGQTFKGGKTDFNIHARLKKNDIPLDLNNPMMAMMLMPYFQANGKLVLKKKDLEQLSKNMPPKMLGMLMMFAKYEGGNAVFVLKFENGHLMINGQPVM